MTIGVEEQKEGFPFADAISEWLISTSKISYVTKRTPFGGSSGKLHIQPFITPASKQGQERETAHIA